MNHIDTMKQALEALGSTSPLGFNMEADKRHYAAITALRLAIEQAERQCCCGEPDAPGVVHRTDGPCYMAEKQEPVAWVDRTAVEEALASLQCGMVSGAIGTLEEALHLAPPERQPEREWAGLTDEERSDLTNYDYGHHIVCAVEAKLREKNTTPSQRQPLTEEEIVEGFCSVRVVHQYVEAFQQGVRFAERKHGIGGEE